MTRLLVSVRSAAEAKIALGAGADLIDIKEPARGALGAADRGVMAEVLRLVAACKPTSAALGELINFDPTSADELPVGLTYIKLGLAGCGPLAAWPRHWARAIESIPRGISPVAVIYADWRRAEAPPPEMVLERAKALGCPVVLIDTFDKSGGDLLAHWHMANLADLTDKIRAAGLLSVLAGSLTRPTISQVLPLGPDYVAVRGAVCRGDRTGDIDAVRVGELAQLLRSGAKPDAIAAIGRADLA